MTVQLVGREIVQSKGQTLYIVYPDGMGPSKLTVALIAAGDGGRQSAVRCDGCDSRGAAAQVAMSVGAMAVAKAVDDSKLGDDFREAARDHLLATTGWGAG